MKLALAIVCAAAPLVAAEPLPPAHALVALGASAGREDDETTHTVDLSLAGRVTPSLWGIATGRAGSSDHPCGDCVGDGKLREATLGLLFLPCHRHLCVGGSAVFGYARREVYYPGGRTPFGDTVPPSYELENWLIAEARGRLMVRVVDHLGLEADVGLRYQRRLYDPTYPNAGGALVSIALDGWL